MGPRTLLPPRIVVALGPAAAPHSPTTAAPPKTSINQPRVQALTATLSVGSRNASFTDLSPKEIFCPMTFLLMDSQSEVYLLEDTSECPICLLLASPEKNRTQML